MDFSITERKVDTGKFAVFSAKEPVAQIFVPASAPNDGVSFFWQGQIGLWQADHLVGRFILPGSSFKLRVIGESGVSTIAFDAVHPNRGSPWFASDRTIRHFLFGATQPASLGLEIEPSPESYGWPEFFYIWASIGDSTAQRTERSEIGIKISLDEWHREALVDLILLLLRETARLDSADARDLWSLAHKTAVRIGGG